MKSALIFTWSGFQDHELVYPYYRLLGDKFNVKIVGDKKDEQGRFYGIFGLNMPCHVLWEDFDFIRLFNENDLLILPGGVKSLEKLRQKSNVCRFINEWNKAGKVISSTCHGAQLLISSKVVSGRKISGYYSLKDDINNAGATYMDDPYTIDRNIISSPHYDHMGVWMEETLKLYYEINE